MRRFRRRLCAWLALLLALPGAIVAQQAAAPEGAEPEVVAPESAEPEVVAPESAVPEWGPLWLMGREVAPGSRSRLQFLEEASFLKDVLDVPVFVARGTRPGPTLCVVAAIHGDEVNGVEVARHVYAKSAEQSLAGTLVVLPIVNVWGFRSGNRYLPDRRDLNRAFPGSRNGSTASRIAAVLFESVVLHCDALVDLHSGSNERTNLPQIRVDLGDARASELALHFAVGIVVDGAGPEGSLRREANKAGVPAIIYEAGGPNRFEAEEIARGIEGVTNVMEQLDMLGTEPPVPDPQLVYRSTRWVRSPSGGIFLAERRLGEQVRVGDRLGTVTDPISNVRTPVESPFAGTLIGMAHPQVVLPGFGLFHLARHEVGPVEPAQDE